jgi:hypothetical protein
MLDYDKSINKLIERVKLIHQGKWSPTPEAKALAALAKTLEEAAALMDRHIYIELEEAFNQPLPGQRRRDGAMEPGIERDRNYAGIRYGMLQLAEFAKDTKAELPKPNKKYALPFAASGLVRIWYQAGKDRPALHDKSEAVIELGRICESINIQLSPESLRNALSVALKSFDPNYDEQGIDNDIIVVDQ